MSGKISSERQLAYYAGAALMVIGGLLFFSVFISGIMSFGDFTNFTGRARSGGLRAFTGMALLIVGQSIRVMGARGLAGSGVVLNPEQAREELEPYSRMAGGMVKDALDQANINLGAKREQVIKVKCQSCGKLNDEDAKFCQACGKQI